MTLIELQSLDMFDYNIMIITVMKNQNRIRKFQPLIQDQKYSRESLLIS